MILIVADCTIIIWKLSEDEDDHIIAESSFGSEDVVNKERWVVHKILRRYSSLMWVLLLYIQ